ncbi:hypothetical protein HA402_004440 [Bradysia odoriphaga]|nr:hypothetical protein HA402_004440 [Bradysia odoriphaga]
MAQLEQKQHIDSSNNVFHTQQQVYHQQIIVENTVRDLDLSYCEFHQKNKPQSNSVAGGILLLFVSGMHTGWGIWRIQLTEPWTFNSFDVGLFQFLFMSWFVFAVVGSVVGAVLVTRLTKKSIYYVGGALLVPSSIIFIALSKEYRAIIAARCVAGLAHGIVYNATITHATENVVKDIRGMLLSSINCVMFSGVFVSSTLVAIVASDYTADMTSVFGVIALAVTVLAIVFTIFLTYESVPFLLRRGNESEAIINLLKLRNESFMTPKLTHDLEEMKLMVGQDVRENANILADRNASVTGKMVTLRVLAVMTNNFMLNYTLISMVALLFDWDNYHMAPAVLSGSRFIGSLVPVFSTDFFKRKSHLAVSSVTSGSLLLVLAIIVETVSFSSSSSYWILGVLSIAFQLFVSIGIDPLQHLLLSEAFSTSKKAWSMALVTSVDYCLQILFVGLLFLTPMTSLRLKVLRFITVGIMLVLALFLQLALPETFKKSIKETRDLFRK